MRSIGYKTSREENVNDTRDYSIPVGRGAALRKLVTTNCHSRLAVAVVVGKLIRAFRALFHLNYNGDRAVRLAGRAGIIQQAAT